MDVKLIDKMIIKYLEKPVDYLSNIHPPTYPDGYDVEIFPFKILKKLKSMHKKIMRKNM